MACLDAIARAAPNDPALALRFVERFAPDVVAAPGPTDPDRIAEADADAAANLEAAREDRARTHAQFSPKDAR